MCTAYPGPAAGVLLASLHAGANQLQHWLGTSKLACAICMAVGAAAQRHRAAAVYPVAFATCAGR